MGAIRIRPEADIRAAAQAAYEEHRARVVGLLPGVEVEHVGSTAVPGAQTKGDVDLLVRVQAGEFDAVVAALREVYAVHQPENWTPAYASFTDRDDADPPVGVQVAIAGSPDDALFGPFRDALTGDPALLAEYNALKLRHDGEDYELYTEVKGRFVERVLRELSRASP